MSVSPPAKRGSFLFRDLWHEDPVEGEYRRKRLMVTGPYGTLLGIMFGVLAAGRWSFPLPTMVVASAVGGLFLMWAVGLLESLANAVADRHGYHWGLATRVGADLVGGASLGHFMGIVLDAGALTSLAGGASLLACYSAVATRLFLGDWVEKTVHLLTGMYGAPRPPDYSYPDALAARGEWEQALREYEALASDRPKEADPIIHAAWTLRGHRRWHEALAWFRRALATPKIDARRAASVGRQVWEIGLVKLEDPAGVIEDLEALVTRFPDDEEMEWARRELKELKAEAARSGVLPNVDFTEGRVDEE